MTITIIFFKKRRERKGWPQPNAAPFRQQFKHVETRKHASYMKEVCGHDPCQPLSLRKDMSVWS